MIDEKKLIAKLEQIRSNSNDILGPKKYGRYTVRKYLKQEHVDYLFEKLIEYVNSLAEEENKENGRCEEM